MNDPSSDASQDRLEEVLADYMLRLDRGETVDHAALIAAHPDLADELRSYFADSVAVRALASTSCLTATPHLSGLTKLPAPALPLPATLGDYTLLEELVRGGMGIVYRARQTSLQREVAVKVLLDSRLGSARDLRRFRDEAEAAARLEHPHLVPIYEVGEHEGLPYFSMKLVDGGNLAQRRAALASDFRVCARVLARVADAVHYAHQRGILHRDLKPANVLLDVQGHPYVTDFGLARRLDAGPGLTPNDRTVGTPSYMAPEQALGQRGTVTTAADVYGLGAILYELLVGRPPFEAETPLATLKLVLDRDPEPPRRLRPEVPRDLEAICLKCLDKEPARRYASAAALAEDLGRWLRGEPIVARPAGPRERLTKWVRRNPTLALLVLVSVLALGSLVGGALGFTRQLQHEIGEKDQQRQRAEGNLHKALEMINRFYTQVSEEDLLNQPGMSRVRRQLLTDARASYSLLLQEQGESPRVRAALARATSLLAGITADIDSAGAAVEFAEQAVANFEGLVEEAPEEPDYRFGLMCSLNQLSRVLMVEQRQFSRCWPIFDRAISLGQQLSREGPGNLDWARQLAVSHAQRGALYAEIGQSGAAEQEHLVALRLRQQLVAARPELLPTRADLASTHLLLALHYRRRGQEAECQSHFNEAQSRFEVLARERPGHTNTQARLATCLSESARTHSSAGRPAEALVAARRARDLWDKLRRYDPEVTLYHREALLSEVVIADALLSRGELPAAEEAIQRAMQALRPPEWRTAPSPHPDLLGQALVLQGNLQLTRGKAPEAEAAFDQAVVLLKPAAQRETAELIHVSALATAHQGLAEVARLTNRRVRMYEEYQRQLELYEGALRIQAQASRAQVARAGVLVNLGHRGREDGNKPEALTRYAQALEVLDLVARREPENALARVYLRNGLAGRGGLLHREGRLAEAIADYDRAIALSRNPQLLDLRTNRALARSQQGDHAGAVAEAEQVAAEANLHPVTLVLLGRTYACAAAGPAGDRREQYAAAAVVLLSRAHQAGAFRTEAQRQSLRTLPERAALNARADFQELLRTLGEGR